jgi:tetratricopeptide (TPR) repeat protein/predicted Ser/Thr protein kinase
MHDETRWFRDSGRLLDKVRLTQKHWGNLPEIAGYDVLVEERRGGQGVVYRARQRSTNRTVAIKVLLDGLCASDTTRLRFEREAGLIAHLRHPNIVRVHDSGVTPDGRLFFVMEYVQGKPLDDPSLRHAGDLDRLLALFARVCDAVQHAHQRGVIHRDLKPSNILIDEDGEPQILDFGLATVAKEEVEESDAAATISRTGQFLGSLAWASPEQIECAPHRIDTRSDVYALGVVLYQLLTGRLPHPMSSNLRRMLDDITTEPPPGPRSVRADIPSDVETIVLRCLAKEPERRYQAAGDLAGDVRRYLSGEPIDAKRDEKGYVLRKTLARYKLVTGLAAAMLISLVAFALTMAVFYRRAVDAEQVARANLATAETQTDVARAVQSFLDQMLSSVDPSRDGRDVRVLEVLERGVSQVDTRFGDWPEVEAELRTTFGLSYRALGLLDAAAVQLEKALALRDAQPDVPHVYLLESLNELGQHRVVQGDLAQAEVLLERALELSRSQFGEDHEMVLETRSNLAALRNVQGRLPEAEALLQQVLDARLQTLGETHPRTIRTIHNLALVLDRQDKSEQAEAHVRRALELHEQVHGRDHVHTVRTKGNLGKLLMERGDLEQAEPLIAEAVEGSGRLLGDRHPETTNFLHNLAVLRQYQGRDTEALELARRALEASEASLPGGHLKIARYRDHVGACLTALGRFPEAELELLNAHGSLDGQLGNGHPYTQDVVIDLIELYEAWDEPTQAGEWRERLSR